MDKNEKEQSTKKNEDPSEKMKKHLKTKGQDILTNLGKITQKLVQGSNSRPIIQNSVNNFVESEKDINQTQFVKK